MADQKLEEKLQLMVPTRLGGHYQTLLHSDYAISCCVGTTGGFERAPSSEARASLASSPARVLLQATQEMQQHRHVPLTGSRHRRISKQQLLVIRRPPARNNS